MKDSVSSLPTPQTDKPTAGLLPPAPSAEGVKRFKELYQARFGVELADIEAATLAHQLLILIGYGLTPCPPSATSSTPANPKKTKTDKSNP